MYSGMRLILRGEGAEWKGKPAKSTIKFLWHRPGQFIDALHANYSTCEPVRMIGLLRWGPVSATDGFRLDIDVLAMYKIPVAQKRSSPLPYRLLSQCHCIACLMHGVNQLVPRRSFGRHFGSSFNSLSPNEQGCGFMIPGHFSVLICDLVHSTVHFSDEQ